MLNLSADLWREVDMGNIESNLQFTLFLCGLIVFGLMPILCIAFFRLNRLVKKPLMTMDDFIVLRSSLLNSQQSATVINWDVKK